MIRGRTVVGLVAVAVSLIVPPTADAALRFRDCDGVRCARLAVPLDRSGAVPGQISLYIERRGAARGPARGTTLLLAGGPGQPATSTYRGSRRNPYAEFRRYTPRNDILAIDTRGTGRSGLLRCRELQGASLVDAGSEAAACARRLGARRGFYRTIDSVEDIEAVRAALGVDKLTLVGVSYGTFLAQAYAAAHPHRVASLLLDSVLDVSGWDPLYRDIFRAVPRVLRAVCARGSCDFFTDDPVADVNQLVQRLAAGRLSGRVTLPNGRRRRASIDRQELFFTLVSGDLDEFARAAFPGAVAAALHGDSAPILRLLRHSVQSESGVSARELSAGLYAATTCEEIPFPWPRFSAPSARFAPVDAAVAQIPPAELYPFDAATDAGNDFIRMCRRWPEASPAPAPAPGPLPDVPVLMLSGQVDLRTPVETATTAVADWPHAQLLTIPDTGHSVLSADFSGCAMRAARRFFRGQAVAPQCRRAQSAVQPIPPPPQSLGDLRAAPGVPGRRGRTISAVELMLFDVLTEFFSSALTVSGDVVRGGGLRGGRWELDLGRGRQLLRLRGVEYLPGLRVSGTVRRFLGRQPEGDLRLAGRGGSNGVLHWSLKTITGTLDGKPVRSRSRVTDASAARTGAERSRAATAPSRAELLRVGRRLLERRGERPPTARRLAPR